MKHNLFLRTWLTTLSLAALGAPFCTLGFAQTAVESPTVTVADWLAQQPKPQFFSGHTLPPLTRFGWTLEFDARVELAEHWGYEWLSSDRAIVAEGSKG